MATSAWFDYNGYMANKLVQLQKADSAAGWDMVKLVKAFADAGFVGDVGAEQHFQAHGQYEDVAPNAFFNATEYYRAKAADFYKYDDPKKVSDLDAASIQVAIKDAGMSAWSHYEKFGSTEKINPSNSFDTEAYMNAKLTALNSVKDGKQYTLPEVYEAFKAANLSALEHFMIYGGKGAGEVTQKYDPKNPAIPSEFEVPESKKVSGGGNSEGGTFTLTNGVDVVNPTIVSLDGGKVVLDTRPGTGDDTINATSKLNTAGNAFEGTLNGLDEIDGGGGYNKLVVQQQDIAGSIKNIQEVVLKGWTDAANAIAAVDMSSVGGLKKVVLDTYKEGAISGDAITGLGDGTTVAFKGRLEQGTAGTETDVLLGFTGPNAGIELQNMDTDQAVDNNLFGANNVQISDAVKHLTLSGTSAQVKGIWQAGISLTQSSTTSDLETITVKAAKDGMLWFDALTFNKLNLINGSESEGAFRVDVGGTTSFLKGKIIGGAGDDFVRLNQGAIGNVTFDGSKGGYDRASVRLKAADGTGSDEAVDYAKVRTLDVDQVVFEAVGTINGQTAGGYLDMSQMGGKHVGIEDKVVLVNIGKDDKIFHTREDADGASGIVLRAASTNTDGIVNFVAEKSITGAANSANKATIEVNTAAGADATDWKSDFKVLNLSGDGEVVFTNTGGKACTINAKDLSGGLTITSAKAVVETVTFGDGKDVFKTEVDYTNKSIDIINNFGKGDKVMFATNMSGTFDKVAVENPFDLQNAIDTSLAKATKITVITYGNDLYVVEAGSSAALTDDAVVKLTGVSVDNLKANFAGGAAADYIEFA